MFYNHDWGNVTFRIISKLSCRYLINEVTTFYINLCTSVTFITGYDIEKTGLDGINQWQFISNNLLSSRDSFVLDIQETYDMQGLIIDSFKYIRGKLV